MIYKNLLDTAALILKFYYFKQMSLEMNCFA